MPIKIERLTGEEMNKRQQRFLRAAPSACCISYDHDQVYTHIDMTDATLEEQSEFMEKRGRERIPSHLTSRLIKKESKAEKFINRIINFIDPNLIDPFTVE